MKRNHSVACDTVGKYTTDLFTDEAVRLIEQHDKDEPMFLYLAHDAVHASSFDEPVEYALEAPEEEVAKFSYIKNPHRRTYAGKFNFYWFLLRVSSDIISNV